MKIKKIVLQIVMLIGVAFILFPYSGQTVLAFTTENSSFTQDNIKIELKQIKEISKPTWGIINSSDSRDGKYHSH